ncbi:MAG: ATP-binding protein [Rhabdochlamydiaceae bacterium]
MIQSRKFSFRKKVFLSQFTLLLLFISILYPLIEKTIHQIIRKSLENSIQGIFEKLPKKTSLEELIDDLDIAAQSTYFRISLINDKQELIYDSHLARHLGERFMPRLQPPSPDIEEAFDKGGGYGQRYSQTFAQKFIYVATLFHVQDQKFLLRASFPSAHVDGLTQNVKIGFILISAAMLLFFMIVTWLIFFRMSIPLQRIINAVKPYEEGSIETLPYIEWENVEDKDETAQLAHTLNSLSARIKKQINDIKDERNEKESILESLIEGVIAVDDHFNITYLNTMASKMLGLPKESLLKKPLLSSSSFILEKLHALLHKSYHQKMIVNEAICLNKKVFLDLIAAPSLKNHGGILLLQDTSSQHVLLEMGKSFIANASHELRTPITIIRGFAETLQDMPDLPKEMIMDIVEKILRNCQRMESLVKNLLTLADLDNLSSLQFESRDLLPMLENCKHMILSIHPQTQISILCEQKTVFIEVDLDLIELAVMNLMENGIKYSPYPASLTISIEEKHSCVLLSIEDKGIGIPHEDVPYIFERFYTVDKGHSRRLGGAGLGLSIVKTIIDKHKGKIKAVSEIGKGTSFQITLPKNKKSEF